MWLRQKDQSRALRRASGFVAVCATILSACSGLEESPANGQSLLDEAVVVPDDASDQQRYCTYIDAFGRMVDALDGRPSALREDTIGLLLASLDAAAAVAPGVVRDAGYEPEQVTFAQEQIAVLRSVWEEVDSLMADFDYDWQEQRREVPDGRDVLTTEGTQRAFVNVRRLTTELCSGVDYTRFDSFAYVDALTG